MQQLVTYSMVNSPPWRASHQRPSAHLRFDPYCKDSQERCLASILQTNHGYIHLRGPNVMKIVNDTLETQNASGTAHHMALARWRTVYGELR